MLKIFMLLYFKYVMVDSLIPNLSVRKTDKRLIARKRQDTYEMCRIFTEESDKIKQFDESNHLTIKEHGSKPSRIKRSIGDTKYAVNPTLNETDVQRVESIVEKLYDDLEEKGERVNYRHQKIPTVVATTKTFKNVTARRFNFAPAELLGPLPTTQSLNHKPETKIMSDGRNVRFPRGIVPYFIDSKTYDADLADIIMKAFDYFEKATCIRLQRLREHPTDKESLKNVGWLYITNPSGIRQCVHSNERKISEGVQMVVFGYDCMSLGDIAHEIMHVLGFSHEHTRSDRDQYITIVWDNIKPGYKKYFDINKNEYQNLVENLPYDYASVLHYPSRAFSKNGQLTILTEAGTKIGQREGLSETDIEKISLVFSNECIKRNREYLLKTCPSVVRAETKLKNITQKEIEDYFSERLWPFGIVTYKLRDKMEFSTEEKENIKAVIRHIEKETCLEFRDISTLKDDTGTDVPSESEYEMSTKENNKINASINPENIHSKSSNGSSSSENSFTDLSQTENEIIKSKNKMKQSGSDNEYSETDIKQFATDIKQSETDIKQSETDIKQSENEIKESDNEIKKIDNKIESINNDDDYDELNKKALESKITELKPKLNITNGSSSEYHKSQQNTTNARIMSLKMIKLNYITVPHKLLEEDTKQNIARIFPNKQKQKSVKRNQKSDKKKGSRQRVKTALSSRRHANNILVLTRSSEPGCKCPDPGRPNGNKILAINTDCFNSVNDLLHLFVHVLGLDHQHNMHDRDSYLHVNWDKLSPDIREEMKTKLPQAASVGFLYDYQSVMHYPWLQIKNGVTNIMYPIWNDGWAMGHWQGLSSTDVQKLNLLYFNECVARSQKTNIRFK